MRTLVAWTIMTLFTCATVNAQIPKSWRQSGVDSASASIKVDTTRVYAGRRSLQLQAPAGADDASMIAAVQVVSPAPFRGHRVRLSAVGRTEGAGEAAIWMRVEGTLAGAPALLALDNMLPDRAVTGTTDWLEYEVVLDVPLDATAVAFGAILNGTGQFWVDQFAFEVVSNTVTTTSIIAQPRLVSHPEAWTNRPAVDQPSNLGFED